MLRGPRQQRRILGRNVCINVCMHLRVVLLISISLFAHAAYFLYACIRVRGIAHLYTYAPIVIHMYIHMSIFRNTYTCVCTYMCVERAWPYKYICVYIYMYIYICPHIAPYATQALHIQRYMYAQRLPRINRRKHV